MSPDYTREKPTAVTAAKRHDPFGPAEWAEREQRIRETRSRLEALPGFKDLGLVERVKRQRELDDLIGVWPSGQVDDAAVTGHVSRLVARYGKGEVLELPSKAPVEIADFLIDNFWTVDDGQCLILRTWAGAPFEWHATHWEEFPTGHLKAVVCRLLENAMYEVWDAEKKRFVWKRLNPNQDTLSSVVAFIEQKTIVHARLGAGHWIDCTNGACPVGEGGRRYVSFRNYILDVETGEQWTHSSAFFNTYSLSFGHDPMARAPRWERALEQWFPNDKQAQDALEEELAWLVLGGVTLDKIIVWLGEPRGGKGTIMRLVGTMLGKGYTTQSMDELADRFALEDLIGVLVCHIAEAASTRETRKVVSLMKSVSGRDYKGSKIKRKGEKSENDVTLDVKFVMTGNEDLALLDDSGVIIDRLLVHYFGQSFLGKEHLDPTFEADLAAELSGIFNRVHAAHRRLLERGRLIQPDCGLDVLASLREKAAPDKTWFNTYYEVTGDQQDEVAQVDMLASYQLAVEPRATEAVVGRIINGLIRGKRVTMQRPMRDGERFRVYKGLRARPEVD